MKHLALALALALALTGCKKDKDAPRKDERPTGSATPDEAKPAEPKPDEAKPTEAKPDEAKPADVKPVDPPPADPTASWTEQKGLGFVVTAARAPTEESSTAQSPIGPQPVTMYVGYEPDGLQGSFQAAVSDLAAAVKAAGALDPKQTLDDSVQGLLNNIPEAKVEKDEPLAGDVTGRALLVSGNHPQGGPFHVNARIYLHDAKIYMVQALYVDANDAPLAAKFVESFKLVD